MSKQPKAHSSFHARLKQARQAAGLSQKQLGIQAGIDEFAASARVNRYELGIHQPDFDTAARLANVLQVPLAYLFADDDRLASLILAFSQLPKSKQGTLELRDLCQLLDVDTPQFASELEKHPASTKAATIAPRSSGIPTRRR